MYPLGEYQFSTANVLGEYLCQKVRTFINCVRRVCNSEALPQTQQVQKEEINIAIKDEEQLDPSSAHPFPWPKKYPKKRGSKSLDARNLSLQARREQYANSRFKMSSLSSIKHSINDSILGTKHHSIRKSVYEIFREEEVQSIKILSGKCGDVRIDSANCMVYKCFKALADIELDDEEKVGLDVNKMAEEEASLFCIYYGAGSAEKYIENGRIWVKMKKIEGTDLERLEDDFDTVIEKNVRAFYGMLSRLFSLGICHGDFLLKNILFHNGEFYPIDFCQSSWDNMEDNLTLIANIASFIQNEDEKITLSYELEECSYNITLDYQNKAKPAENKTETFIITNLALGDEGDDWTRL